MVRGIPRIRDGLLLGRTIGHLPCAVATHTIRLNFLVNGTASSRVLVVSVSYRVPQTGYLGDILFFTQFLQANTGIQTILDLSHVPVGPAYIGSKYACGVSCVCVCVCVYVYTHTHTRESS